MKKYYISGSIILLFLIIFIAAKVTLNEKNIKNFIYTQFYKATNDNITINKLALGFKSGIYLNLQGIKIFNQKKKILFLRNLYINIKLLPLLKKIIYLKNVRVSDGVVNFNFDKLLNKKNSSKSLENGKLNILARNISITNIKSQLILSNEELKYNIKKLFLKNFSLNKNFQFNILSELIYKGKKGNLEGAGSINILNSSINANITMSKWNLNFLKRFGFYATNCNFKFNINGNFKNNLKGTLNLNLKDTHIITKSPLYLSTIILNSNFKVINKNILLKKSILNIDNNILLNFNGKIVDFKNFNLNFNTNKIKTDYLTKFLHIKNLIINKGCFCIDNGTVNGAFKNLKSIKFNASFFTKDISGVFGKYKFSKLNINANANNALLNIKNLFAEINNSRIKTLSLKINRERITGKGKFTINLSDIPKLEKQLTLKKGIANLELSNIYIPLKNFNKIKLKFCGKLSLTNSIVSYDFFKDIKIKTFYATFNEKKITLLKSAINFRDHNYQLTTTVKSFMKNPVKIKFSVIANYFDEFFAQKLLKINIGNCNNIYAKINFKAKIDKKFIVSVQNGYVKFKNSNTMFFNRKFENISGKTTLKNNTLFIKQLIFTHNHGKYILNGKLFKPFKEQLIDIRVKTDTIDRELTKLININQLFNLKAQAHITGSLKKIKLKWANINFINSKLSYKRYVLNNLHGNILFNNNIAILDNITFLMFNGKYSVNGKIISPFKKGEININVKTNIIDKFLTEKLHISPIKHVAVSANIGGNFKKFYLASAIIDFNNSRINYSNFKFKNISGKILFKDNIVNLKKIAFSLNNVNYMLYGKITNPFEQLRYSLFISTHVIDSMLLKQFKIKIPTIKPVNLHLNIFGSLIDKKLKFHINEGKIIFLNSDVGKYGKISGKILINNKNITIKNFAASVFKGNMLINGMIAYKENIKKGFLNITGKNFIIPKIISKKGKKINNNKKEKYKQKAKKQPEHNIMEKVYNLIKHLDFKVNLSVDNVTTHLQNYKNIKITAFVKPDAFKIKNFIITTNDKGFFKVNSGYLIFGKTNKFKIDIDYDNINIGDFVNLFIHKKALQFRGIAKKCFIKVNSNFKKFSDYEKNLNGKIHIFYEKGYINKAPLIANIFSILNVLQVFKFKLPDLDSHGFSYKDLIGDFIIKNGIVSTNSLKLSSDSINLVYFGDINLIRKNFNSHIAVYPFKTVDSILKHIPIIGYLFTDRKGSSGLMVIYFRLTGPLNEPKIAIQPAGTVTKKVESVFKNIIKLPFKIFTSPGEVILPGSAK